MHYPPAVQAWWMAAVFCIAGFVSYTHRLILSVLVDPIQADLGIGDSSLSLLQGAAFALIYVVAGLPLGRLADRSRRRIILISGGLIWCLGTILCGFAPSFWTLFAARAVVGIGEAALAPAAASMIGDSFPPHRRGTAIGIFFMGMAVGGPAAIAIGGILLGMAQSGAFLALPVIGDLAPWRAVLILSGGAGLIVPLLILTLKEPKRLESVGVVPVKQVITRFTSDRRLLMALLIGIAMLSVGDYGLLSWVPTTLTRVFEWTPERIGPVFGLITAVAGISGSFLGGFLSDVALQRGGPGARMTLCIVAAIIAAFGAALIASPNVSLVFAGLGIWIFSSAVGATGGIAALQDLVPNELRGVSMSLVAFCNTLLGLGCGPTVVALMTEQVYGYPSAVGYAISSVVVPAGILAAVLLLVARHTLKRRSVAVNV